MKAQSWRDDILQCEDGDLAAAVVRALEDLLAEDCHLFAVDVHERSIAHKFADYLGIQFPGWDTDVEYNRDRHDPKVLGISQIFRLVVTSGKSIQT